jgi:hypothetical protein
MDVSVGGKEMLESLEAYRNAPTPIDAKALPCSKVTVARSVPLHEVPSPSKAESPMLTTPAGTEILLSLYARKNAEFPIDVSALPVSKVTDSSCEAV